MLTSKPKRRNLPANPLANQPTGEPQTGARDWRTIKDWPRFREAGELARDRDHDQTHPGSLANGRSIIGD